MISLTTYEAHHCKDAHYTWPEMARCTFPRAVRVKGDGAYAAVTYCGPGGGHTPSVYLFDDYGEAQALADKFDRLKCRVTGCGGCNFHRFALLPSLVRSQVDAGEIYAV